MHKKFLACTLLMVLGSQSTWSVAEDIPAARACAAVKDPTSRLACYDAAFAVAPVSPTAEFGVNAHMQKQREVKVDTPKSVDAIVTRAVPLGQQLYQLTLDNGQVWVTRQGDWTLTFESGDAVTIIRLPLGGFQLKKGDIARTLTVRRIK